MMGIERIVLAAWARGDKLLSFEEDIVRRYKATQARNLRPLQVAATLKRNTFIYVAVGS